MGKVAGTSWQSRGQCPAPRVRRVCNAVTGLSADEGALPSGPLEPRPGLASPQLQVLDDLCLHSACALGTSGMSITGALTERQHLRPQPKPAESEPALS